MRIDERTRVEATKKRFVKGTKVRLIEMMDDNPFRTNPKPGAVMTVSHVDDLGQIHGTWNSGGTLALLPGVDEFELIESKTKSK